VLSYSVSRRADLPRHLQAGTEGMELRTKYDVGLI
jgi:hypothetical protein